MSTTRTHDPARRPLLRRIAEEPLAQFLVIGLAVFAIDRVTAGETVDPKRIVLDDDAYAGLVGEFAAIEGRAPTPDEMVRLADQWVMNETLYREARALRLDEGDEMVRERVMQKLRVLIYGGVTVGEPDEAALRAYFEENRARYDQPERVSFRLAQLDGDKEQAAALAARLNAAFAGEIALEPGEVNVYPFPARPRPVVESVFGPDMVAAIVAGPLQRWVPIDTARGWQVAFFEGAEPGDVADFEAIRRAVAAEWRESEIQRAARRSLDAMMAGYDVEREPYDPAAFAAAVEEAIAAAQGEGPRMP